MPSARKRQQARLRKRLKAELTDQSRRQQRDIERAIANAALRNFATTEEIADLATHIISVWNSMAAYIERKLGFFFPVRLKHVNAFSFRFVDHEGPIEDPKAIYGFLSNRLTFLAATSDWPEPYQRMNDLLFTVLFVPEVKIRREASDFRGWWHQKGRKLKENIALNQANALADALDKQKQVESADFWRRIRRLRAEWESAVARDRSYSRTLPVQLPSAEGANARKGCKWISQQPE
jgi:hypothetical protein